MQCLASEDHSNHWVSKKKNDVPDDGTWKRSSRTKR